MIHLHVKVLTEEVVPPVRKSFLDGEQLLFLVGVSGLRRGHPLRVEGDGVLVLAGALMEYRPAGPFLGVGCDLQPLPQGFFRYR
jgi:hypothetical protein